MKVKTPQLNIVWSYKMHLVQIFDSFFTKKFILDTQNIKIKMLT